LGSAGPGLFPRGGLFLWGFFGGVRGPPPLAAFVGVVAPLVGGGAGRRG
jgi:hypothetical protein